MKFNIDTKNEKETFILIAAFVIILFLLCGGTTAALDALKAICDAAGKAAVK